MFQDLMRRCGFLAGAAALALAGETSMAQRAANWRQYKFINGLPAADCSSVTADSHGHVWVRHARVEKFTELDGYDLFVFSLPGARPDRVYASAGRQPWTLHPDGLQEFNGSSWIPYSVPELASAFPDEEKRPPHAIPLVPVMPGRVLFLVPDALMELDLQRTSAVKTALLHSAARTGLGKFSGLVVGLNNKSLWIAADHGLAKAAEEPRNVRPESRWEEYPMPEYWRAGNLREPFADVDGGITAVADAADSGRNLTVHFDGRQWTRIDWQNNRLRQAWRGPDHTLWATMAGTTKDSRDTLFVADLAHPAFREVDDIQPRHYNDLAIDPFGGAFWLATSDGLFRYAPRTWRPPESAQEFDFPIRSLAADEQGRVWVASADALYSSGEADWQRHPFPSNLAARLRETQGLFPLANGTLVIEGGQRLSQFVPETGAFRSLGEGEARAQVKALGVLADGTLCVQRTGAGAASYGLELFDGNRFRAFPFPEPDPGLGRELLAAFSGPGGDLWISGTEGVAWYHDRKWQIFRESDGAGPAGGLHFLDFADGKVWCSTRDRIWQFDGRGWVVIKVQLDQINGLSRSLDDAGAWVASSGGLYRYFEGSWLENGIDEGLASTDVNQICDDHRGHLWAATARGLSEYHKEADRDPPKTTIQKLAGDPGEIQEGATLNLSFSGRDKWNYTVRERLLYSYRLDEQDWSPFQESNTVSFPYLPAGNHVFQVRAMDRNCRKDPRPQRYEFEVTLPWYRESRLILIAFAGAAVAVFFAGLAFNRHWRLVRSYAEVERKVAERTRQLELANRELLQSQKMTALGTLAAGIAHDFNNILSIIKGSAQIIEDNLDHPEKVHTRVDRIKTVVEQGAGIVRAMLGFSRGSDLQPGPCDLNAVMEDTRKLLGDRFLREVEIRIEPAPNLPQVAVAKDFIQQILLNFLFNASDAMTERRQVILTTGQTAALPAGLVLAPEPAPAYVFVSVRDFGCGISPETLPRIFEPFFTTKALSARRGTGLGLSMAYELAKKMSAGIAVESVLNQGSTFTLILPVKKPAQ